MGLLRRFFSSFVSSRRIFRPKLKNKFLYVEKIYEPESFYVCKIWKSNYSIKLTFSFARNHSLCHGLTTKIKRDACNKMGINKNNNYINPNIFYVFALISMLFQIYFNTIQLTDYLTTMLTLIKARFFFKVKIKCKIQCLGWTRKL